MTKEQSTSPLPDTAREATPVRRKKRTDIFWAAPDLPASRRDRLAVRPEHFLFAPAPCLKGANSFPESIAVEAGLFSFMKGPPSPYRPGLEQSPETARAPLPGPRQSPGRWPRGRGGCRNPRGSSKWSGSIPLLPERLAPMSAGTDDRRRTRQAVLRFR